MNYKFQVGGPEYSCSFPNEEDIENSIFIVKGRNDQGKSTLMQMIALGLFGLESEDIEKKLKDQMRSLNTESIDKCEFDFTIASKDGKVKIKSNSKDGNVNVLVNDKRKGSDYIQDKIKLIFDVPEEPIVKLDSALKSIKGNLREYEELNKKYLNQIKEILDKIDDYEHKENGIIDEEEALKQKKLSKEQLQKRLADLKNKFKDLEKGNVVVTFSKNWKEFNKLDNENKLLQKRIKKLKSAGLGGGNKKYHRLKIEFINALKDLKFLVNTATHFEKITPEDEKKDLSKFAKQINAVFTPQELDDDKLKGWRKFLKYHLSQIESNTLINVKLEEEDELQLIKKLIEILEDFVELRGAVPGTGGKTVSQFILDLEGRSNELEATLTGKLDLERGKEECNDLIEKIDDLARTKAKIPRIETAGDDDLDTLIEQQKELTETMKEISKQLDELEDDYNSISEEDKNRYSVLEDQVEHEYEDTKNKIKSIEEKIKNYEIDIKAKDDFISALKKVTKPPKYNKEKLKSRYNIISKVSGKIEDWLDYIQGLNLTEMKVSDEINVESKKFYTALADYFANIIEWVFYENQKWKVNKVDFINRCYVVEERSPISFDRIGTGHTALNSLMFRLRQNYGGRKKVVLFDEIGLMDKDNINRLLDEIKTQVKNNEILFALLAKVDDDLEKIVFQPVKYV